MESWKNEFVRLMDLKLLEKDAKEDDIAAFIEEKIAEKEADLAKWKRALQIYRRA